MRRARTFHTNPSQPLAFTWRWLPDCGFVPVEASDARRTRAILIQRENPAVHGVDETLRVSFAHQNASRSGDGRESRKPGGTVHTGLRA